MTFPFDLTINLTSSGISGVSNKSIKVYSGITTLLGPNGSGKTQLLRGVKVSLAGQMNGKKIRYVSAGRLGPLENFRSDYDGHRGSYMNFEGASFGSKDYVSRRHAIETIVGDIGTISERPDILIKIQERLKKLFNRDLHVDWDGGVLKLYFARMDYNGTTYSSAREASGLLHLVAILAALYDDEVGCLLIDEPEVSLHPQLQSFLLSEIKKVAGSITEKGKKLIFISTHSTEFIELNSVDHLASIVFCKDIFDHPIQIDPSIGEFRSRKIQALLSRLGQEHKLALFSHKPLLVEGPSDQILCTFLSHKLDLNTEAAGSQILPVTGKGQFPVIIKLMRLIGKKPAILADADALTDSLDIINSFMNLPEANILANEKGHRDASGFAKGIFDDFCLLVLNKWDDVKSFAELHYYWVNRDKDRDENIAKRRAAFSWILTVEESEINKLNNSSDWFNIRRRLLTLLDFLEQIGCFILRKGTIEAYYRHSASLTNDEKPNAASNEAACLLEENKEDITNAYSDLIRAIKFVSSANEINEAEAIRNMLLAIVSPAVASVNKNTTEAELISFSNSLFGAKAGLFKMSVEVENEDVYLNIDLSTNILDVTGFPFRIKKGANPIEVVNSQLGLK